jgi:hypothetical protein
VFLCICCQYEFHFDRFIEYERSIKAALKSIPETETRMEILQSLTGGDLKSVEFLLDANKTVIECRRALKWSYVIAYYLEADSRQLHMFQLDQGQLEKFSDELHGLIELPVDQLIPTMQVGSSSSYVASKSASSTPPKLPAASTPTASSPSASSASASASPAAPVKAQGEELRKLIVTKTSVANKYLVNLVDAVFGGQYVDLTLNRLPSA